MSERPQHEPTEADPFEELFDRLRDRACATGDDSLTPEELVFYSIGVLLSDLQRGAFQLFFEATSRDVQQAVEVGLGRLAETEVLSLVREAKRLWMQDEDWFENNVDDADGSPPNEEHLARLTASVLARTEALHDLLERFAVEHALVDV